MAKNNTSKIMKRNTDILKQEGKVDIVFDEYNEDGNPVLYFILNKEIIKYHRHRNTRFNTYDPMKDYKLTLKKMIEEELNNESINISDEVKLYPIKITCEYFQIPAKSHTIGKIALMINKLIKRVITPDIDNFVKTTFDVFNNLLWYDDSQVYNLSASKHFDEEEKTIIKIEYIKDYLHNEESTLYKELLKKNIITEDDILKARSIKNFKKENID